MRRNSDSSGPTVLVLLQRWLPRYRVSFLEGLRTRLAEADVRLEVVHGQPKLDAEIARGDAATLPWADAVESRRFTVGGLSAIWLPSYARTRTADLVIVEQVNSLLLNHLLLLQQVLKPERLCFWGHGRDLQAINANSLSERFKRHTAGLAHWWFAYTTVTAQLLVNAGVAPERITVVQNAVDARGPAQAVRAAGSPVLDRWRERLDLPPAPTAVFLGSLERAKRVHFLLEAARRIRDELPDFQLLIIGGGPDAPAVRAFSDAHPWAHYLGARFEEEKAALLALADVLLLPAAVNLAILDGFAMSLPVIASASATHMPEIAYLEPGVNGLLVEDGGHPERYAAAVINVLTDVTARSRLSEGAQRSSSIYTIEAMVERFADGVLKALAADTAEGWWGRRRTG